MANENQVITALFYLTRACNIDCSYCRIWDNHFPNELSLEDKLKAIDILWEDIGAGFIILFGGEPLMLGDDLIRVVAHCAEKGIRYAITSNSIGLTVPKAKALVEAGLQNWSVSVDQMSDFAKDPIGAKSMTGLRALHLFDGLGVEDLHVTVTITKNNIHDLLRIADYCNSHGFWVEFTALHWQKNEHYYFASPEGMMPGLRLDEYDMRELKPIMDALKQRKRLGHLIHNDEEYFDAFMQYALDLDWYCEGMSTMVVDADGQVKTCLHYNQFEDVSIFALANGHTRNRFLRNTSGSFDCEGCFWDCKFQSQQWARYDPLKGRAVFQHLEEPR